jgi:RIO kinase 1
MRMPSRLQPLLDANLIEDVVGQLKSGKEAEVYVVLSNGEYRCAKVYKEANNRSFKNASQYTEGRKSRNSRDSRAMNSGSRHGRKERESEWQNTEVEALTMLAAAGVRVPRTYDYYEGVILLEMIVDAQGQAAPRLNDVTLTKEKARECHQLIMRQVVLMLCAGYVHGDLSEFNILLAHDGPVIIDLPQAIQSTANNAFRLFERDLVQLAAFFGRFAPEIVATDYAHEMWKLYENGKLKPDTKLTGYFQHSTKKADVTAVLEEIRAAEEDEMIRRGVIKKWPRDID